MRPVGLRILKVCTSRSWGGMEMSMTTISGRLRERGHDIQPVCFSDSPIHRRLLEMDFRPTTCDLWGKFHPFKAFGLSRLINRHPIDIVHTDYSRDLFTLVPALKWSKPTPLVLHKHVGTIRPKNLPVHPYLYRNVDFVIAISRVIEKNLLETHPLRPEQVGIIHHGIDMARFVPDAERRQRLRQELGLAGHETLVGIVGRLTESKGHLQFLEVARRILPEFPDTRFVIVGEASRGEDEEANAILDRIEQAQLGDRMILTGYREDVPDLLGAMDLFLFPTHAEAFGLVIVEAMAMGLPVVSADCDGVPDIVQNGVTGILADPRDVTALTAAVTDLLIDGEKRRSFGLAGRHRAQDLFSEEKMCAELERLYRRLLENNQN
jgi:glycosyltransferase involved in cell wall biosynthesis